MCELQDVEVSDLAGIYSEIAEQIGVDKTYTLYKRFHGLQLLFPQKFYSNECIARLMKQERDSGANVRSIARKYGYSEGRVHQILRLGNDSSEE